jgi:subtilisin family serine protease
VVVATLDTGVDVLHPDLGSKWRGGSNSWFDPYRNTAVPYDVADPRTGLGHGTAVMGILVGGSAGGTAIGVTPDARWIAAKIFNDAGVAENLRIHQGFQWLLDPDGNPGTDDAPDVVNNSWGFEDRPGECISEFRPDVQALRSAGIAMAFAAGNTGSLANTSVSPANYPESFAVGAVDQALAVPLFSARGPSACDGTVYPEVVAPGVHVRTADLTSGGVIPASYALVAGTSFSAPHVTGALALLFSALPGQSATALEAALRQTATDLGPAGPDNSSGSGLINALAAYNYLNIPAPNISILPSASFFNFGTVPVNGTLSQGFTITNVGNADLLLEAIAVTGLNAAEFALSNDLCSGRSLVPSAGCTFEVIFAPLTTGKKIAAVAIPSNDPDTPLASIVLVGNELVRIGTFRRGEWFIDNGSGGWDAGGDTVYANFGAPDDIPVTGDWNGDGKPRWGLTAGTLFLTTATGRIQLTPSTRTSGRRTTSR